MPKLLYYIKTPLGEFTSSGQAAAAHKVDRSTILTRCETLPEQYQKIPKPPAPKVKKKHYVRPTITSHTWPITWHQYKWLPEEVKEEIWQAWCIRNQADPDSETAVNEFFDQMDQTPEPTEEDVSDDQEQTV